MDYEKVANIMKAIGHPVRLRILEGLSLKDDCNVNDMVSKLNIPQSTLSQHLGILRTQGLIVFTKRGINSCYKISDERVLTLLELYKG